MSLLYGAVIHLRNRFYDWGWLKSTAFEIPVISVGNLSVGGTGKTPMVEYLVRLLQKDCDIAILSRGYGRKTRGFLIGKKGTDAEKIGDEPYQYFRKFKEIQVAVDEDRVRGATRLLEGDHPPEVILLDDAFQHRRIQPGLSILLTSYDAIYSEDWLLPTGNLREGRSGAKRANLIVISKCPNNLKEHEKQALLKRLSVDHRQEVFFSGIRYAKEAIGRKGTMTLREIRSSEVVLVTGIANPGPLQDYLKENEVRFEHLRFPDHHKLNAGEIDRVSASLNRLQRENSIVLTTEKDYVRNFETSRLPVYYIPIETCFLDGEDRFNTIIKEYVRKD